MKIIPLGVLFNSRGTVEQTITPTVEQTITPTVEQESLNPILNPNINPLEGCLLNKEPPPHEDDPSALDEFLGPQTATEPVVVGNWRDQYQDWSHAGGSHIRARHGVSEAALRHTHYLLLQAGKAEPRSDAGWKPWVTMLFNVYQESGGDWELVTATAQEIASRGKFAGNVVNWHNIARQVREKRATPPGGQPIPKPEEFETAENFFGSLEVPA